MSTPTPEQAATAAQEIAKTDGWGVAVFLGALLILTGIYLFKKITKEHDDFRAKVKAEFHVLKEQTTRECIEKGNTLDSHGFKITGLEKSLDKVRSEVQKEHATINLQLSAQQKELIRVESQHREHKQETSGKFEKIESKIDDLKSDLHEMENKLVGLLTKLIDKND